VRWPLADHLGTVRDLAVFDDNGTPDDTSDDLTRIPTGCHFRYDAFGSSLGDDTPAAVDFLFAFLFAFTGRPFDADTGLQWNLHRWYDAATGRWLSEDPLGFSAGDANLYCYVGNQATVLVDPTGETEKEAIDLTVATDGQKLRVYKALLLLATRGGKLGKALALGAIETQQGPVRSIAVNFVSEWSNVAGTHRRSRKILNLQDTEHFLPTREQLDAERNWYNQVKQRFLQNPYARIPAVIQSKKDPKLVINFPNTPGLSWWRRRKVFLDHLDRLLRDADIRRKELLPLYSDPEKAAAVTLGHELGHALIGLHDPGESSPQIRCGGNVTLVENRLRKAFNLPARLTYNGFTIPAERNVDKKELERFREFMARYERAHWARKDRLVEYLQERVDQLQRKLGNP